MLSRENDLYNFVISDNGIGYTDPKKRDTLGMMIIDTLATMQLDGEISIDACNGTEITIQWRGSWIQ